MRVPPFRSPLLALLSLPPTAALAAPLRLPVSMRREATTTWAENIARTASTTNGIDALRHEARFTASVLTPLATGVSRIAEADAGYEPVPRYPRNTAFTAGARTHLRWKFGLGA